ncbi:hypothetical protein F1735_31710 [Massilia sp. CCM 8694]|uniref:Transcriptional regulator n=1 Tax=Massilia genomosp. 1 TaxID=2609280 RepID=A0ABX0N358_9BURK|nr:hypothetical protein [Massilia genomosp. 1]
MAAVGVSPSSTAFAKGFNLRADGAKITSHAARKWLFGESIPTQGRIQVIAAWMGVNAAWLRFGEGDRYASAPLVLNGEELDPQLVALIKDLRRLPEDSQAVVRGLIDVLLNASVFGRM